VHILSASQPGRPVENPRQCPAFRYSKKYGPLPPAFARATVVRMGALTGVLIGGTASVRGEDTVFAGSLPDQLDELFLNLASLLAAAHEEPTGCGDPLPQICSARVYYPRETDRRRIEAEVRKRLTGARSVEWVHADLCRPDLMVEIEGVATIRTTGTPCKASNGNA
jgi:chorismate lyase / 3-hydroxybenzoate synthase